MGLLVCSGGAGFGLTAATTALDCDQLARFHVKLLPLVDLPLVEPACTKRRAFGLLLQNPAFGLFALGWRTQIDHVAFSWRFCGFFRVWVVRSSHPPSVEGACLVGYLTQPWRNGRRFPKISSLFCGGPGGARCGDAWK